MGSCTDAADVSGLSMEQSAWNMCKCALAQHELVHIYYGSLNMYRDCLTFTFSEPWFELSDRLTNIAHPWVVRDLYYRRLKHFCKLFCIFALSTPQKTKYFSLKQGPNPKHHTPVFSRNAARLTPALCVLIFL